MVRPGMLVASMASGVVVLKQRKSLSDRFGVVTVEILRNRTDSERFARAERFFNGSIGRCSLTMVKAVWIVSLSVSSATAQSASDSSEVVRHPALDEMLAETLSHSAMPGVVVAVARAGQPVQMGCAGLRNFKEVEPITIDDKMHLGSCTKAMTATMIGRLVDQGELQWTSTVAQCLPDLVAKIHSDYHPVTLEQLLMHRGGIPAQAKNWWHPEGDSVTEKRRNILITSLAGKPDISPGTQYHYSNLGYMMAGLMAGTRVGATWEELMRRELFDPLQMQTAGFGPPSSAGSLAQPWGHRRVDEVLRAVQFDNAPALGPAGTVHCSLADWVRFANVHFDRSAPFLTEATRLHLRTVSPELKSKGQTYALGWRLLRRQWARGPVLSHSGSNTLWYSAIFMAPQEQVVYLVATNIAAPETPKEVDKIFQNLIAWDKAHRSE